MTIQDDLFAPDVIANPHLYYGGLQREEPVHWNERWGGWILTRYDDIVAAYQDRRLLSDRISFLAEKLSPQQHEQLTPALEILSKWIVFSDPPDHARFRSLVSKAFTPRRVEQLRPRVRALVDELLEALPRAEPFDLIPCFSYPLPVTVIAEMIGVRPEDRDLLKRWSDEIALLVTSASEVENRRERSQSALLEFTAYLREIVAWRRREPGDDLISVLITAEEEGQLLTEDEVLATCSMILFAGHETTSNLIANGVLALLRHPDQLAKLQGDPALIPGAVEEMLRYDPPARAIARIASEDLEIGGKQIRARDRVLLVQSAANRDPAVFPDPDRFDITRQPNPHIAFAYGPHFCLGAALARMETQIAVEGLLERLPRLRLATDALEWKPALVIRALVSLPVCA